MYREPRSTPRMAFERAVRGRHAVTSRAGKRLGGLMVDCLVALLDLMH